MSEPFPFTVRKVNLIAVTDNGDDACLIQLLSTVWDKHAKGANKEAVRAWFIEYTKPNKENPNP